VIIFWIFTLFVGASTFAFTDIFLQLGIAWSIADALVAMLLCRGIFSMVRRSLVLRERISAETDTLTRTVETNRAIFWRRALFLAALPIAGQPRDDWRLMYVNKDAIDQAAEALIAQGELMGDEISGLLDSVGMRLPTAADPYPPELPMVPDQRAPIAVSEPA
jgi:hypothetical protein